MGIVAFNWAEEDNNQLTLVMNRDNCDKRQVLNSFDVSFLVLIDVVDDFYLWSWDDHILSGRCEENNGTWLGISKRGRVAFLVDTLLLTNVDPDYECSEMYPITFLESDMSPRQFSCYVAQRERKKQELRGDDDNGWPFCLIVADMTLNSMYHIRKPLQGLNIIIQPVPFGVHTLSPRGGLNSTEYPRDLRLRGFFNQMIGDLGNDQLPPLKEIAEGYMYDAEGGEDSVFYNQQFGNVRYGTTSTTVLAVQRTEGVTLFERYMDSSGAWCEHDFDFTFNID